MALFSIERVKLAGISACVPKNKENNWEHPRLSKTEIENFISTTGVEERRIVNKDVCTSDLCIAAAEKLIADLNCDKEDIDIVVFVSQSPDYILPVTSAIIQDKLGLKKGCLAIDIPLGCSGYVYGISVIAAMIQSCKLKKGLLLVGDTTSKIVSPTDKSAHPLFGDAAAASLFEYSETAAPILFDLGTDGSGYKAIIVPDGGFRNPYTKDSLTDVIIEEGIKRNNCQLVLDGMDVFSFGISQAPKTVNALVNHFGINKEEVDHFIFHQANMMMNKMVAKKLKLAPEQVPYSLKHFGNTSSATIPLTIVTELRDKLEAGRKQKFVLCGFGVGLSWGTIYVETTDLVVSELVEYE